MTSYLHAAHELGHAIMHPDANTPFLRKCTGLLISKMEIEANKFAAELLIDDEVFLEFQEFHHESDRFGSWV